MSAALETIVAIATPPGVGGIGVLRISGPDAFDIGAAITANPLDIGRIQLRKFYDGDGEPIDHGVCLAFRSPHSFSGEDCVELQGHGGPVVLDLLLERVCQLGARMARAGEFSERAFLNGRIDLTQAEAIADLIQSGSRAASRAAMRALEGRFSDQIRLLADEVIELRALLEASLDFAEEEIDLVNDAQLRHRLDSCADKLNHVLRQAEQGRKLQEGLEISLAGLPNAGKSSLLNTLAGYDAAIVTDIAGTTRDVLREHISLRGIPLRISDTAGLRDSTNPVEREGVRRAWKAIDQADLTIFLIDASRGIQPADQKIRAQLPSDRVLQVYSKADLLDDALPRDPQTLYISVRSGEGIETLIDRVTGHTANDDQADRMIMARRRHVDALRHAGEHISQAIQQLEAMNSSELVAEELRWAQQHLNEITGEFTHEDLLGAIFSKFCIGK